MMVNLRQLVSVQRWQRESEVIVRYSFCEKSGL